MTEFRKILEQQFLREQHDYRHEKSLSKMRLQQLQIMQQSEREGMDDDSTSENE